MAETKEKEKEDNLVTYITEDYIKRNAKAEQLKEIFTLNLNPRGPHKIRVSIENNSMI